MSIFKSIAGGQKWSSGFSLIELLVILAIMGAVSAVMALTFSEVVKVTTPFMSRAVVMAQVHQAGERITKDVVGASSVTAGSYGSWTCSMVTNQWNDGTLTFTPTTVTYTIDSTNPNNKVLKRNGVYIAQYISTTGTDNTSFVKGTATGSENNTYWLTIKAVYNNASFNKTFKICQRVPP